METALDKAAEWLATSSKTIVLTGAGASTESGIPDFRSAEGLWARFDPGEYATLGAFRKDPEKVWRMLSEMEKVLDTSPNPGHRALAALEAEGALAGIITQNIDGLHQAGGSQNVVEFHGSGRTFSCLGCGASFSREQVSQMAVPPACPAPVERGACATILKPDVVFFDEMIPGEAIAGAARLVQGATLILVAGTSCEVYPASEIPVQVRRQGGKVVEINVEPAAELDAELRLTGKFGELMPRLHLRWQQMRA